MSEMRFVLNWGRFVSAMSRWLWAMARVAMDRFSNNVWREPPCVSG